MNTIKKYISLLLISIVLTVSMSVPAIGISAPENSQSTLGDSRLNQRVKISGKLSLGMEETPGIFWRFRDAAITLSYSGNSFTTYTDNRGNYSIDIYGAGVQKVELKIVYPPYKVDFSTIIEVDFFKDKELEFSKKFVFKTPKYLNVKIRVYDDETGLPVEGALLKGRNLYTDKNGEISYILPVTWSGLRWHGYIITKNGYREISEFYGYDTFRMFRDPAHEFRMVKLKDKPVAQGNKTNSSPFNFSESQPPSYNLKKSHPSEKKSNNVQEAKKALNYSDIRKQLLGSKDNRIIVENIDVIPLETLKLAQDLWIQVDSKRGNIVTSRMSFNISTPTNAIYPKLSIQIPSNDIKRRFSNARVIKFVQPNSFGLNVEVAVKLDLTGLNTDNLIFYQYQNKEFTPLNDVNYYIDSSGYLHFNTTNGGTLIITD